MVSLANAHNEKELSIHLNDSIISNPFGNLVEVAARTVESSSYKFNQTKNKTVKKLPLSKSPLQVFNYRLLNLEILRLLLKKATLLVKV